MGSRGLLIVGIVLLGGLGLSAQSGRGGVDFPGLSLGQSAEQVRERLGAPSRVSRQVILLRCLEQWHYGAPHSVCLEFVHVRGQKPVLRHIRKIEPPTR